MNPDEAVDPMARGDKLTYNANAGGDAVTGMPNAQAANDDSTVYVSTNIPSRAGYTFLGWASDPSAAEAEYYPGQKLTLDGDLTLYAVWQKSATLSYNGNGADTEVPASETNVAGWIALAAAAPARDGYRFDGWLGSDGITYQPGDEVEVKEDLTLTAAWVKQVTLHYELQGADSTEKKDLTMDAGTEYRLNVSSLNAKKAGYQFLGWDRSAGTSNPEYYIYYAGMKTSTNRYYTIQMDDDVTLYAIWGNNYHLAYDANANGENVTNIPRSDNSSNYGTWVYHSNYKPNRSGYDFVKYTYDAEGTQDASDTFNTTTSGYFRIDHDVTLYAQWTPKTYTVSFDLNGGSGTTPETIEYTLLDVPDIVLPTGSGLSKEGCIFLGWCFGSKPGDQAYTVTSLDKLSATYKKNAYAAGATIPGSVLTAANKVVYAVWAKTEVKLYVDANGGKALSGYPKSYSYGTSVSLPNGPTFTGRIFKGWFNTNDGNYYRNGNISAGAAGKITIKEDTTIVAVWDKTYVTFMDGDTQIGQEVVTATTIGKGPDGPITAIDAPVKEHYTFKGWAKAPGGAVEYADKAAITVLTDTTLYAVYELNKYTVTYSADDAETDVPSPAEYDALTEITVAAAPERTGYDFKGWADGDGNVYQPGDTFELTKNVTLTATWEARKVTITFHANAEDATLGSPAIVTRNYGVNYTISTTATREHYNLLGWASTEDATEAEYKVGGKIMLTEDLTLYAVWQGVPVAVEFDANGGDPIEPIKAHFGDVITLPAATRQYYNFLGWTTADETEFAAGDTFTATEDIVFTAQWEKIVYTLHFDAQGGATSKTDVEVEADATYSLNVSSGNATKAGFQFLGWDTDPNATDPAYYIYYEGVKTTTNRYYTLTLEGNTTLYAIWGNNYHLVVDGNLEGRDVKNLQNNNNASTYGTWVYWSNYKPTCSGFTFVKWTYDAAGTQDASDVFKTNGWYKIDADTTLYAQWSANTYTVSFDLNGGSGTKPEDIEYTLDTAEDIILPAADGYAREGYTFIGWSFGTKIADQTYKVKSYSDLTASQKKNAYAPGATIPASALTASNKTIYAIWAKIEVKLSIITTGGLKPLSGYPKSFSYGDTASLPLQGTSYKKTYTLGNGQTVKFGSLAYTTGNGFYCAETGTFYKFGNTAAGAAGKILMDKDYELIWVWKNYVVEYRNADGAYLNHDLVEYGYGTGLASAATIADGPEKEYFTFKGWATAPNSTQVAYAPGASYGAMEDIVLYAVYEPIEYTLIYVAEGVDVPEPEIFTAGTETQLDFLPTRSGYVFIGWTDTDSNTYEPLATVTMYADLTVTAVWHELTHVEATDPTCEENGNIEYWYDAETEICYENEFGDGELAIEDTVLPALGHTLEKVDAVAATCEETGIIEHFKCSVCGKLFADENAEVEITEADTIVPALGHTLVKVTAVAATCKATGNIEYFKCSVCGKLFADENAEVEITEKDTITPALGHSPAKPVVENYVNATATRNGSYDLVVYCSRCGEELSRRTIVIPATGTANTQTEPVTDSEGGTVYRISSFGPKVKDTDQDAKEDDESRFTAIDLTEDGEYTFPLVVNDRYYGGMIIITIEEGKFEVSLELEEGFVLDEDAFYALFTDAENIDVEDENVKHYEFDTEYVIADELPDVTDIILYVSASATYDGNPAALKLFDANTEDNVKIVTDMMELIGK